MELKKLNIFYYLFSLFVLIHFSSDLQSFFTIGKTSLSPPNVFFLILNGLNLLSLITYILYPKSYLFYAGLSLLLVNSFILLPHVPNHVVLLVLFSFFSLLQIFYLKLTNQSQKIYPAISALASWGLILAYYISAFHKLNTGYFDIQNSCAVVFTQEILSFKLSPFAAGLVICGSLLLEVLIPSLLIFKRTRDLGLLIGICFHTLLSFHSDHFIFHFSFLALVLYVPFFSENFIDYIKNMYLKINKKLFFQINILIVSIGLFFPFYLFILLAVVLGMTYAFVYFSQVSNIRRKSLNFSLMVLPYGLLIVLNGMSPYLGLKTQTDFSMFSNLRSFGNENNHILMPPMPIANYQTDVVKIIDSDHSEFRFYIGMWINRLDFHRLIHRTTKIGSHDFYLVYKYQGTTQHAMNPEELLTFLAKNSSYNLFEYWFLKFKPILKDRPSMCLW